MSITANGVKERNGEMKNGTNGTPITDPYYKQFNDRLEQITRYLKQEVESKQQTIDAQRQEIEALKSAINDKTAIMAGLQEQISGSTAVTEGNRQLVNKLLNDIAHLQNDIDWYKRTYERRSIWGVLKDKISRKKS